MHCSASPSPRSSLPGGTGPSRCARRAAPGSTLPPPSHPSPCPPPPPPPTRAPPPPLRAPAIKQIRHSDDQVAVRASLCRHCAILASDDREDFLRFQCPKGPISCIFGLGCSTDGG